MFSRVILRYNNNFRCRTINGSGNIRQFAIQSSVQPDIKSNSDVLNNPSITRTNPEWINSKPFEQVPRVPRLYFLLNNLPGGKFYNISMPILYKKLQKDYGPIVYIKGSFGQNDILLCFDAVDFEKVLRADGPWPTRDALMSLVYYQNVIRKDIFQGNGGLLSGQGKNWGDMRSQANPIMLNPKNIKYYISQIDQIAIEFVERTKRTRDPHTLETSADFETETNRWSLESVASVALNTRLGLLGQSGDTTKGEELMKSVQVFFQLLFELDFLPSIWKYYKTPKFKRLMKAYDSITEISLHYINESESRYLKQKENNKYTDNSKSILTQLLEVNRQGAIIIALDLLLAGIDTTSTVTINTLYRLAKNPEKQERLREEVLLALPEKDTILTEANTRNLPYLRACIKETLRMNAVAGGVFRNIQQDLVLSGYQIPKGTKIILGSSITSNSETYFNQPTTFLPERWLRHGTERKCREGNSSNSFAYIPFGFGPRMCIGQRLAQLEAETVILRFLRNFQIEWHHADLKHKKNLINTPDGDIKFKLIDLQ